MKIMVRGALIAAVALLAAACPREDAPPPVETPAETPTPTPTPDDTPDDAAVEMELEAEDISFDEDTLSAQAGAQVAMEFKNRDSVPHNFALYGSEGDADAIFAGEIVEGPAETTYRFQAPAEAGSYYFQCDVHPNMNGTFEAT